MEIGQKLKEKRTVLGLSQEQLAEKLGVTRQTIANWEKGKTYPDITAVMKLSDLYGVSLDELLKEDASMRKHVEDTVHLPRHHWNILFEIAILLLPFGQLVGWWGLAWVGTIMQAAGLLMLPPLWIIRHKQFGMPASDLRNSIIGWSLVVGSIIARLLTDNLTAELGITAGNLLGLLLVYGNGIYLERGKRFWLVIFLYVGIPIYILGSSLLSQYADQGGMSKAQPFLKLYRIEAVEYGETPEELPLVDLDSGFTGLRIGGEYIGEFEYVEPISGQEAQISGIWHLVPEDTDQLYKLEVSTDGVTRLSFFVDDQLQFRWRLTALPKVKINFNGKEVMMACDMEWFPNWDGDLEPVNSTTYRGDAKTSIQFSGDSVTSLTLVEEYHWGDRVETRVLELPLHEKHECFYLPENPAKRYDEGEQYILYRFDWDGGEFLFCLKFQ